MNTVNSHEETTTIHSNNIEASNESMTMEQEQTSFQSYIDLTEDMSSCYVLGYN